MAKFPSSRISVLSQLIQHLDRPKFMTFVKKHLSDKFVKTFKSWMHLVAMVYAQLSGALSLRDVEHGFEIIGNEGNHMGIFGSVPKSTLSFANANRGADLFEDFFNYTYSNIANKVKTHEIRHGVKVKHKFKFHNPLISIDSTSIELCLKTFDWALYKTNKGAVKLHMGLDNRNYLPCWAYISDGKMADVKSLAILEKTKLLQKGAIVVMDRGYIAYDYFHAWTQLGIFFVTRAKSNMSYKVVEHLPIPGGKFSGSKKSIEKSRVLSDSIIKLTGTSSYSKCPSHLRLVNYWDVDSQREFEYLTNNFKLSSKTICDVYKDRWAIESFFKAIKQNLKIKSFLGTSYNAVRIQLYTALISMLILKYIQFMASASCSLSGIISLVRQLLFDYIDFQELVNLLALAQPPPQPSPTQPGMGRLF
jgi:hypothetical protein